MPQEATKFKIVELKEPAFFKTNKFFGIFIQKIAALFGIEKTDLLKKLLPFFDHSDPNLEIVNKSLDTNNLENTKQELLSNLTHEQLSATKEIKKIFDVDGLKKPILLHGVTGSGKSQIYLQIILECLQKNQTVIFLVPEVSLALNFYHFFKNHFIEHSNIVFAWHSAEKLKSQRNQLWNSVSKGLPCIIIGVHLPIFLPIKNLGAIIIDEEHEDSFFEKQIPYLDTRFLALIRAQTENIPIILGSATPSIHSYLRAKNQEWILASLPNRFSKQALPTTQYVTLKPSTSSRPFWFTQELEKKIQEKISKKEQVIIFLNRTGLASLVQCKNCQEIFMCKNCSVSLTLHEESNQKKLCCHYCNFELLFPAECEKCLTFEYLTSKGLGTEQVCKSLEKYLPNLKILRADSNTIKKKSWHQQIHDFSNGKLDILVGTKCVTKGYHFPNVTLVGVLWADLDFYFPEYNATERAIQQLLQVSGRSGRGELHGEVLIQAFDPSLFKNFATEKDYVSFLEEELISRKRFLYPPFTKMLFLEFKRGDEIKSQQSAKDIKYIINNYAQKNNINFEVFGPTIPAINKKNNNFYRQLIIKIAHNETTKKLMFFLAKIRIKYNFEFWLES